MPQDPSTEPRQSWRGYQIENAEALLTPALAIYPEIVDSNIAATLRLFGGDPNRWRPHLKTAKLGFIMRRLAQQGVVNAKCSTTVELAAACEFGMQDVLLAYAVVGANAKRARNRRTLSQRAHLRARRKCRANRRLVRKPASGSSST